MVTQIDTGVGGIQNLLALMIQLNRQRQESEEARREREEVRAQRQEDIALQKQQREEEMSMKRQEAEINRLSGLATMLEQSGDKAGAKAARKRLAEIMGVTLKDVKEKVKEPFFKGKTQEAIQSVERAAQDPVGTVGSALGSVKDAVAGGPYKAYDAFWSGLGFPAEQQQALAPVPQVSEEVAMSQVGPEGQAVLDQLRGVFGR